MSILYCDYCCENIDTEDDTDHFYFIQNEPQCTERVKDEANHYHNQDGSN